MTVDLMSSDEYMRAIRHRFIDLKEEGFDVQHLTVELRDVQDGSVFIEARVFFNYGGSIHTVSWRVSRVDIVQAVVPNVMLMGLCQDNYIRTLRALQDQRQDESRG